MLRFFNGQGLVPQSMIFFKKIKRLTKLLSKSSLEIFKSQAIFRLWFLLLQWNFQAIWWCGIWGGGEIAWKQLFSSDLLDQGLIPSDKCDQVFIWAICLDKAACSKIAWKQLFSSDLWVKVSWVSVCLDFWNLVSQGDGKGIKRMASKENPKL